MLPEPLTVSSTHPERLRVFVADDDAEMCAAVCETLEIHGCVTQPSCDGVELLDQLIGTMNDPALRPHVIVVDVKMPRLSGLGVLMALRRASWTVPVVLITALKDESVQTVSKRHGAVALLRKPFDPLDLVTAVQNARAVRDRAR